MAQKTLSKSSKVRGLRLTPEEEVLVDSFLEANPIFDFTTLARAALRAFVSNPQLVINPVSPRAIELPKSKTKGINNV
jgi:hypothetical protein